MTNPYRFLRRMVHRPLNARTPHLAASEAAQGAYHIVTAYYAASVFICAGLIGRVHGMTMEIDEWHFLWPLAWAADLNFDLVAELLTLATLVTALVALQFRHRYFPRFAFAALFLLSATIVNSAGGINHPYHAWFWVGAVFAFLPEGRIETMGRAQRLSYLTTFLTAQLLFMLFYTMAGLWKVVFGARSALAGQPGNFSFEALSWTIADRTLQTGTTPLLADLIISYPIIAWPGFVAVMYIQLFALHIVFRPRLVVIWGYGLIAFHIGTWLLMEIIFVQHVFLLVLLMVLSPMAPRTTHWRAVVSDLPLIGRLTTLGRVGLGSSRDGA